MTKDKFLNRQPFPAGSLVIKQGTDGSRAYLIQSGRVEVFVKNPDGSETKITDLGPGSLFGEMALITKGKRTASVRTLEYSVLVIIDGSELDTAIDSSDKLYKKLLQIMTERLKDTHGKVTATEGAVPTKEMAAALFEKLNANRDKGGK